tara:strand:+ start:1605 stop:1829 length:225 start_codon:yes stop_codon:yes gene_type:complete
MTAQELFEDIGSKMQAESTKYRNEEITLEVCQQNCVNIANTIDTSISNLSSEEQALPVVNEINHIKNFILTNYS